ncbi:MAG TPA: NAD(+)/NADH kinase, partial [Verrucomicrobiae bacterium]|nr:NAD(+)/NADH kinase [Verrucomicrobiae bacterium]
MAEKVHFVSSDTTEAKAAAARMRDVYGDHDIKAADAVVALGGDGLMLETLHEVLQMNIPVYGMNFGSIGFLMNSFGEEDLLDRLAQAIPTVIHPLKMTVVNQRGEVHSALAFNEVSVFRSTFQAAKIRV